MVPLYPVNTGSAGITDMARNLASEMLFSHYFEKVWINPESLRLILHYWILSEPCEELSNLYRKPIQ